MDHADVIRAHELMIPDHVDVLPDHVDVVSYHPAEVAELAVVIGEHDRKRLDHESDAGTMPDVVPDREIMVPDHGV